MRLRSIIVLALVLFAVIPAVVVSRVTCDYAYDTVYRASKQDLEERVQCVKHACEAVDSLVAQGKLNDEEAIELIRVIFIGDKQPGNTRDYMHALHKGKTGYIWLMDSESNEVGSPVGWEGLNLLEDVKEPALHKTVLEEIENKSGWHECTWKPLNEPVYTEVTAYDYYKPHDLIIGSMAYMDEFTDPIIAIGKTALLVVLLAGIIGVITSLFVSQEVAKPFARLSEVSSKITKGDLSARVDTRGRIDESRLVGEDINRMVDSLQSNIEKLKQALGSYSKVLSEVALGGLSTRVDTEKLKGEYKLLGETLNSIVSILEFDTNELRRGEVELNTTILLCSDVLHKVAQQGDLNARVDMKILKGKYKQIGRNINLLINNLQAKIEESEEREGELAESRTYFQNFFNASPVPLTLIGLDGTRLDCNPAMERLTGRSKKDLTNVPVEAAYAKEEQPEVRKKLVEETIEKGHMYGFETYFKRPDGTKLPIVANCSLLRDKEGRPLSIIYSAIDITELKEREEELHKRGREQTNAISAFSKVLDETAKGNLSARIDTKGWNEELETIGMSINSLIESVEHKKKEKA